MQYRRRKTCCCTRSPCSRNWCKILNKKTLKGKVRHVDLAWLSTNEAAHEKRTKTRYSLVVTVGDDC